MRSIVFFVLFLSLASGPAALAQGTMQPAKINDVQFFVDETPLDLTIITDVRTLMNKKMKEGMEFPATAKTTLPNGTVVQEPITMEVRGHYRRELCYMPPLKLKFKNASAPVLSPLGSLKLVNVCELTDKDEEYILKEYLAYKIYNLITYKSFRARLVKLSLEDKDGKKKPIQRYAFLLEDVKDMAKRNGCVERKRDVAHTEATNRQQMTRVALFEYMIGNSDWAVPVRHNIKLIVPKEDTNSISFSVPYDFDHSGLVNTNYALPPEQLQIKSVTERSYRGFERTMDELQTELTVFMSQKDSIYNLVKNFELLPAATRREMINFLDGFYNTVNKPSAIKAEFINNARKN